MLPSGDAVCKLPVWGMAHAAVPRLRRKRRRYVSRPSVSPVESCRRASMFLKHRHIFCALRQLPRQALGRLHAERTQHLHLTHQVAAPARELVEGRVVGIARLLDARTQLCSGHRQSRRTCRRAPRRVRRSAARCAPAPPAAKDAPRCARRRAACWARPAGCSSPTHPPTGCCRFPERSRNAGSMGTKRMTKSSVSSPGRR